MSIGERLETAFGGLVGARVDPSAEAEAQRRERDLRTARRYPELELEDLVVVDEAAGYLTDGTSILQFVPPATDPILHPVVGFVLEDGEVRYLRTVNGEPSFAAWQRRQDLARREAETQAEERRRELEAAPFVVADLSFVEGRQFPTLQEAAELVERNGRLQVRDGRLVVELRGWDPHLLPAMQDAVAVLHRAEAVVVAHLESGEELPDRPISPSGAPIVVDAEEAVVEEETPERRSRSRARSGAAAGALAQ